MLSLVFGYPKIGDERCFAGANLAWMRKCWPERKGVMGRDVNDLPVFGDFGCTKDKLTIQCQ